MIIEENIIVLNSKEFHKYTKIINIIKKESCGVINFNDNEIFIICYITKPRKIILTEENILDVYYKCIVQFVVLCLYEEHNEIINMCIVSKYNGGDYIKKILDKTLQLSNKKIWVGISLNNPDWNNIIKYYLNHTEYISMFPIITNKTPSNKELTYDVLALTLSPSSQNENYDSKKIYNEINELRSMYISNSELCFYEIKINEKLIKGLYDKYGNDKIEHSGIFGLKYNDIKNQHKDDFYNEKIYELGYPPQSHLQNEQDDGEKNTSVYYSEFNWHIHPYPFYKDMDFHSAWLSGTDFGYLLINAIYYNGILHFLLSHEGVYTISINYKLREKLLELSSVSNCLQNIIDNIITYFTDIEHYKIECHDKVECIDKYGTENGYENVGKKTFLDYVNNFNFEELERYCISKNNESSCFDVIKNNFLQGINIYNVNFYTWDYIKERGCIIETVVYPKKIIKNCPVFYSEEKFGKLIFNF